MSRVHGSLLLSIPRVVGFSVVVVLYSSMVNMPLFKVWSEDKLNKKFVVAENFEEPVSTVCFYIPGGWGI